MEEKSNKPEEETIKKGIVAAEMIRELDRRYWAGLIAIFGALASAITANFFKPFNAYFVAMLVSFLGAYLALEANKQKEHLKKKYSL